MIHNKQSTSTSVGTTIGSFDAISTRNGDNTLPDGCAGVYGLTFAGARIATTAAEAQMWRLRVTASALGYTNEDFLVGHFNGAGIATNDMGTLNLAEFIPIQAEGQFSQSTVNFYLSQVGIESTDNVSCVVGPVSFTPKTGPAPPSEWFLARMAWPGRLPAQGSASSNGASLGTTANSDTSLVSTKVRAEFGAISSVRLIQAQDAVGTAGEEAVAWGRLDGAATTISGVGPQEWPFNAIGPALGTGVGGPVSGHVFPMPVWVTKGRQDVTVDVNANVLTAITAANAFGYGLELRR
jgi:hypothetical protein